MFYGMSPYNEVRDQPTWKFPRSLEAADAVLREALTRLSPGEAIYIEVSVDSSTFEQIIDKLG